MKKFIITEEEKNNIRGMYGVISEQEDNDYSMDEYIDWDIKSVDCEGSRLGSMSSMGVNYDDDNNPTVRIRYCKGDKDELHYLKSKARMEIKMGNQLPE